MGNRYVELESLDGHHLADILKSYLQANGVPAEISQESYGSTLGITVGKLGKARVLVPESRLKEAQELLAEYYARKDENSGEDLG